MTQYARLVNRRGHLNLYLGTRDGILNYISFKDLDNSQFFQLAKYGDVSPNSDNQILQNKLLAINDESLDGLEKQINEIMVDEGFGILPGSKWDYRFWRD
jgi:hypothetical protein